MWKLVWSLLRKNYKTWIIKQKDEVRYKDEHDIFKYVDVPAECLLKLLHLSICPWSNLRMNKLVFIKFSVGEFFEKLLGPFSFCLDWTVLMTTLHKSIHIFLGWSQFDCRWHLRWLPVIRSACLCRSHLFQTAMMLLTFFPKVKFWQMCQGMGWSEGN